MSASVAGRPDVTGDDLRLLDPASVRAAGRLLRERYWLRATLAVLVACAVFVLLGRWQLHRHEAKVERRDRVEANYDAAAVPLGEVLASPPARLPAEREWQRVRLAGSYLPAGTVLIRNRPLDGEYGYEVLVPLRTADGAVLLVDRGWLAFGASATRLPPVPEPPAGRVEVVVRLRPAEPADGRRLPAGQAGRIEPARLAAGAGPVYRAYGVLAEESPRPGVAPTLLPRPDTGLGPHLAYAWNWWGFAVVAQALLAYYALREVRDRRWSARGVLPEQVAAARAARARRRGPRDEDWEDAATGPP